MSTMTKEMQSKMTPADALKELKEGNKRYTSGQQKDRDVLAQQKETAGGQFPHAVILSCIDSRTSSEIVFDQGIGDVFNARVAGNVINEDVLGSMEFACAAAGSKLIVVLGHSACGAVKGACDNVQLGNLTALLGKIQPAVLDEKTETGDRSSSNASFVEKVTKLNVGKVVQGIKDRSPVLRDLADKGQIAIVGGVHNVANGEVTFFD